MINAQLNRPRSHVQDYLAISLWMVLIIVTMIPACSISEILMLA